MFWVIHEIPVKNNKVYIGSSNTPDKLWIDNCGVVEDNTVHNIMKELGVDKFIYEVIGAVEYILVLNCVPINFPTPMQLICMYYCHDHEASKCVALKHYMFFAPSRSIRG